MNPSYPPVDSYTPDQPIATTGQIDAFKCKSSVGCFGKLTLDTNIVGCKSCTESEPSQADNLYKVTISDGCASLRLYAVPQPQPYQRTIWV